MFERLRKREKTSPDLSKLDETVDRVLLDFKKSMTEFVTGIESRADADNYVREHATELLSRISDASLAYGREVVAIKRQKNEILSSYDGEMLRSAIVRLDSNIRLLEDSYVQVFQIVNPESPRSMIHYYTQAEITAFCDNRCVTHDDSIMTELDSHLIKEYIERYYPDDEVLSKCQNIPPKADAEFVLKAVFTGDHIGSCNVSGRDMSAKFTGSGASVLALAIYDACRSVSNLDFKKAYAVFKNALEYYFYLFPEAGYEPETYMLFSGQSDDRSLFLSDCMIRTCVIGAYFQELDDVIRYSIIASHVTHNSHAGEQSSVFLAVCVWLALHGAAKHEIRDYLYVKADDIICMQEDLDKSPEKIFDLLLTPEDIANIADESALTRTKSGMKVLSQAMINFLNATNVECSMDNARKYPCDVQAVMTVSCVLACVYYCDAPYVKELFEVGCDKTSELMIRLPGGSQ